MGKECSFFEKAFYTHEKAFFSQHTIDEFTRKKHDKENKTW